MKPLGHHLVMRLKNNGVLPPDTPSRRLMARLLLRQGRNAGLLAFRVVDTHIHLLLTCDRRRAGSFAQASGSALSLRLRPEAPFAPAWYEPVRTQRHLYRTFRYVFRQEERHQITVDPWAEGSNLPDLLGLRVVGAWTTTAVRAALPRVARADLLDHLRIGLPHLPVDPFEQPAVPDLEVLAASAAATVGLPALAGKGPLVVQARMAAIAASRDTRTADLARALELSPTTVRTLRRRAPAPNLVEAVRRQASIRGPVSPLRLVRAS